MILLSEQYGTNVPEAQKIYKKLPLIAQCIVNIAPEYFPRQQPQM